MRSKFALVISVLFALLLVPSFAFADVEGFAARAAGEKTIVSDPDTTRNWQAEAGFSSTLNLGRIWTDKTVSSEDINFSTDSGDVSFTVPKGDSDFLTVLSAISSASNTKTTITKPLDIVLVLDVSGSMGDSFGGQTKLQALKTAVNSFLDSIEAENAKIADASMKHKVSIVKFAGKSSDNVGDDSYKDGSYWQNYSQIVKNLTLCEGSDKEMLTNSINGLRAAGATSADYGLKHASRALADSSSARENAKKVAVFFTDGDPNHNNGFDNTVASDSIKEAKSLKDADTQVFSIGIFNGASPEADPTYASTSRSNKFMHAVSSNYPNASYTSQWYGWTWDFGPRAADSNFYLSSDDAQGLKKIFEEIASTISQGSGFPTETSDGYEQTSGYITFEDQLGDYLKVDGFKTVIFGDRVFENPTKTTSGNIDTYTFSGSVDTTIYPKGDIKNIRITVTRSEEANVGDKVQVKVPAALIPVRYFNINNTTGDMSFNETRPIRIIFGSSVKAYAIDSLAKPDEKLATYIAGHSDDAGNVEFFANKWSGDPALGDASSTFNPAKSNSYYYFTEDTPIYSDEVCAIPAKQLEEGKSYYYRHSYCVMVDGKKVDMVQVFSFPGDLAAQLTGSVASDSQGNLYLVKGTSRHVYINELHSTKTENVTKTATDVLNPNWVESSYAAASTIVGYLGNNGKVTVENPGALSISKTVEVADGYDLEQYISKDFIFEISIPSLAAADGAKLKAQVKDANGEPVGDEFLLQFDTSGKATHTIKHGETLFIYGISAGSAYTVTEKEVPGFTTVAAGDTGTIEAAKTSAASFINTYSATGTLEGSESLKGNKVLTGRDWNDTDAFVFKIAASSPQDAPLPDVTEVTLDNLAGTKAGESVPFNFGDITYTKPGTYVYDIWEDEDASTINKGVSASKAEYQATVTVTDAGDGTLATACTIVKRTDDAGNNVENASAQNVASFVNEFRADAQKWSPEGIKNYEDHAQSLPLVEGMFNFRLVPLDGAPGEESIKTTDGVHPITFDEVEFTHDNIGHTYKYSVNEVIEVDGTWKNVRELSGGASTFVKDGITYDASEWIVSVEVKFDGDVILLNTTYSKDAQTVVGATQFSFFNSYASDPGEYDTARAGLNKVITGRDWIDADSFIFDLTKVSFNGNTDEAALAKMPDPDGNNPVSVTSSTAKENEAVEFNFGKFTFTEKGTYVYKVTERADTAGTGFEYDSHGATITVDVVDNGKGKLVATAVVSGATFTNHFTADLDYSAAGDINITKVLNGHNMLANQFEFVLTPDADSAEKLALTSNSVSVPSAEDGQMVTMTSVLKTLRGGDNLVFTRHDEGKTFKFNVVEKPASLPGYECDETVWNVSIAISIENAKVVATATITGKGDAQTFVYTAGEEAQNKATVSFKNKYDATGSLAITASKVLTGRPLVENEFEFALHYKDETPVSGQIVKNDAQGSIDFGQLNYTVATLRDLVEAGRATVLVGDDGNKTWYIDYVAKETTTDLPGGVSAVKDNIPFTVVVSDLGNGKLEATAQVGDDGFVFKNAYSTGDPVPVDLVGKKVLEFDEGLTPASIEGKFTFTITSDDEHAPMPKDAQGNPLLSVTNDANGNVDFGTITFSLDDLNRALGLSQADITSIQNSGEKEEVGTRPHSEDTASNLLVSTAFATEQQDDNAIATLATDDTGASLQNNVGDELAGELLGADDEGALVGNDNESAEAKQGVVRTHTFTYRITESGNVAGITNDADNPKVVKFKLTDDGQGHFTVERETPTTDLAFKFVNKYSVNPLTTSVTDQLSISKVLTGRDLIANEFTFLLLENDDIVARGTNDASGNVTFMPITYDKPGEHTYYLVEQDGGTSHDGVQFDSAIYQVRTVITDNGDGTLSAKHSFVDNDTHSVSFANKYEAMPVGVKFSARKELKGAELKGGDFTFVLSDSEGKEVARAQNNSAGQVVFPEIEFANKGVYNFTITELNDGRAGYTYDEHAYSVTVTVTDDLKGHLLADVTYDASSAPVFKNGFTPAPPLAPSVIAKTGDQLGALVIAIVIIAITAGAFSLFGYRKHKVNDRLSKRRH